jgi:hypothetical protein
MGRTRPNWAVRAMSAFYPVATTERTLQDVSNVPNAEVIPTRDVAKRGLCDVSKMALLSHIPYP